MEKPDGQKETLWYRLPENYRPFVDDSADYLAVANIFQAMESGVDCMIHERVSRTLLRNLSEFQSVWSSWFPERYRSVEITADTEDPVDIAETEDTEDTADTADTADTEDRENTEDTEDIENTEDEPTKAFGEEACHPSNAALATYTGGIDSSYTVMRHNRKLCGRMTQPLKACLFVHGFDIPLVDIEAFERVRKRLENTLSRTGLELVSMASNHKELNPQWDHTHIAGVASSLMLLSKRFDRALIGSTYTYNELSMKWGSNPVSDRMLSSHRMTVFHDGAETGRGGKMAALYDWPEAYDDLRVCWSAPNKDENCGTCGKCALTLLGFKFKKLPLPKSFPSGLSEATIERLEFDESHLSAAETLLRFALKEAEPAPWVMALKKCVEANRNRLEPAGKENSSFYGRIKRRLSRLSK